MAKEYVPIFFDWLENTQDLSAEEKGNLIDAIVAYASGNEYEHLLTGGCKIAFRFMKGQVDRNAAISEKRSEARTNKNGQDETNDNKTEQTITNDNKPEQNTSNFPKEKEKEKEEENKKDKKEKEKEREDTFNRFWTAYPRHENKQTARKAFDRLNPDDALLATMLTAISRQKGSAQWQEKNGQFIPHPATWLNGRRWEDETKPSGGFEQRDYSNVQDEYTDILAEEIAEFKKGAG